MISVKAIPDAIKGSPVISQAMIKVSTVPVTRQLTALAKLRTGVSLKTHGLSDISGADAGNSFVKGFFT